MFYDISRTFLFGKVRCVCLTSFKMCFYPRMRVLFKADERIKFVNKAGFLISCMFPFVHVLAGGCS